MTTTINMQEMRYLNLFSKITKINTRHCFKYNDILMFCVPKILLKRALGPNAANIKKLNQILNQKIKIIPIPEGMDEVKIFIENIVSPQKFKELEIKEGKIILNAGRESKAALIGRNKRRLIEMQKIIKDFFKKEFKII
jgi:transcription antitermination factor NusA-like protein